ncbi:hypothetical protein Hanom_Chr03g00180791 [Helianthus anomalus]
MMLISSTYTAIIVKFDSDRFIKTHGLITSELYPSFSRYSISRLYHIRPDCLRPYKDLWSFIEHISRSVDFNASGNFNPLGIFM